MLTATVLAVSVVAPLLLLVLVLIKCLGCLRKQDGFKNFENEESRMEARINPGFAMGQDIEEDRPTLSTTAIQIEPLPELLSETTSRKPKITCVEKSRQESALKLVVVNNPYPFPRRQLKYLNEIGSGWFGQVLESDAEHITTGIPLSRVVAKVLKDDASNSEKKLFLEDVLPYRELEHDNVLRLLAQCTESTPYLMILEYAPMGDLKACAKKQLDRANADNYQLIKFAKDAACGLACLHRHGYIHQDFAARNCVVMADYKVKVGDYGISEDIYKSDYYDTGNEMLPVRWMAPESLSQQSGVWQTAVVTREANIWSFGVLLWEMLMYGEQPYTKMSDTEVLQNVVEDRLLKLPEPSIDIQHRDRIFEVMQFCWLNPGQRPSIEDAHGLLQQLINIASGAEQKQENFEKKWNQTIPSEARVVSAKPPKQTRRPPSASFESDFSPVPKSESTMSKQILSPGFDDLMSVKVEPGLSTTIVNMPSDVSEDVAHLQTPFQPKLPGMMTSTPVMDPASAKPDDSDIMKKSNTSGSKTSRKIEEDFEKVSVVAEKSPVHEEIQIQREAVAEKIEDSLLDLGSGEVKSEPPADPFQDVLGDVKSSLPTKEAALQDLTDDPVAENLQNGLNLDAEMDSKKENGSLSFDFFKTLGNDEISIESTEKLNTEENVDHSDQGNIDLLGQGNHDLGGQDKVDHGGQGDFISEGEPVFDFMESSSDNKTDSSAKCDMQTAIPDSTKMAADLGKQTSIDITAETSSSQQPTVQSSNVDFLDVSRRSPNSLDKSTDNLVSSTFQQVESLPSEIDVPQETDEPDAKTADTKISDLVIENGLSGYETHSVDQSKSESNDANSTLGTDSSSDSAVCVSSPELPDAPSSFEGSAPPGEKVGTCIECLSDDESKSSCSDSNSSTDSTNSGRSYECEERNPNIQVTDLDASDDSYDTDDDHDNRYSYETTDSDEDMDLRIASELYLSKGVSSPQVFERPPLETIPEDVMPSPSDTSSVDLKFDTQFDDVFPSQDNFEWDDFMGESIVGRDRTGVSPKASFDMSDWMLEGDSMSFRSTSSMHSPGGSLGSDVTGASDSRLPSTPSVSEVKRVRGRPSRSYVSDLITNRSINPSFTNTKNTRTPFYSLYDTLELDSDSDGGRTSPDSNSLPESHPSESGAVELHDNEEQITPASQPDDSLYIQNDSHKQPKGPAEILEEADKVNQVHLEESNMAATSSAIAADRLSTDKGQGQSVSVMELPPTDLNSAFEKLASQHNIGFEMFDSNEESAVAEDEYNEFGFENLGKSKEIDLFDDFPGSDEGSSKSGLPSVASFFTGVDIPKVSVSSDKVSSEASVSKELEIIDKVSPQEPPISEESFKSEYVKLETQSPEEENIEPEIQTLESVESPSLESPIQLLNLSPEQTDSLDNQNKAEGDSITQSIEILKSEGSLVEPKEANAPSVDDSFAFSVPTNLNQIEAISLEGGTAMSDVEGSTQSIDFDVPESFVDITSISSDSVSQTLPPIEDQAPVEDGESFTMLTSIDEDHGPTVSDADGSMAVLDQMTSERDDDGIQLQNGDTKESLSVVEIMEQSVADRSTPELDQDVQGKSSEGEDAKIEVQEIEKGKDSLPVVEAEEQETPSAFLDDEAVQTQDTDSSMDILNERDQPQSTVPDIDLDQNVADKDPLVSESSIDVLTFESSSNDALSEPTPVQTKDTPRTFSMTEPNKVLNMFDNILYSEDAEAPTTPSELKDGFELGDTTPSFEPSLGSNLGQGAGHSQESTDVIDSMEAEHIQGVGFLGASPENNSWTQHAISDDETVDSFDFVSSVSESSRDAIKDDYIPPSLDLFHPPKEITQPRQTDAEHSFDVIGDSLKSTANQMSVPVTESIIEPEESSNSLLSQPLVNSSLVQPFDEPLKTEAGPESGVDENTPSEQQLGKSESITDNDFDVGEHSGDHGQSLEFIDSRNVTSSEFCDTNEFVTLSDAVTTESNDLLVPTESEQSDLIMPQTNPTVVKPDAISQDSTKVDDQMSDHSGFTGESFSLIPEEPNSNVDTNPIDQPSFEQPSDTYVFDSMSAHLPDTNSEDILGVTTADNNASNNQPIKTADLERPTSLDAASDEKDEPISLLQTAGQSPLPSPVAEWTPMSLESGVTSEVVPGVSEDKSDTEVSLESKEDSDEKPSDVSPVSDLMEKQSTNAIEDSASENSLLTSEQTSSPSPVSDWEPLTTSTHLADNNDLVDKDEPALEETLVSDSLLTVSETPTDPSQVPEWEPLATPSDLVDKDEPELEETMGSDSLLTVSETPTDPSPVPEWEPLATPSDLVDKDEPELEETMGSDSLLTVSETPTDPSPVPEWEPLATPSDLVDKDEPELEETLGSDSLLTVSETPTDPSPVPEWEPLATPSDLVDKDEPELEETLGSDSLLTVLEIPTDPSPVPEWEPLATPSDLVDKDEPELEETMGSDSLLTVSEIPTDPSPVPEWEPLATPSDLVDKDEPELEETLGSDSLLTVLEIPTDPSPVPEWEPLATPSDLVDKDEPELEETMGSDSLLTVSETPTDPSPVPEWEPLATPSDLVDKDEPELEETMGSDSLLTVLEIPTDPSPVPEWEPLATPSDLVDKDEPELEETMGSDSLLTVSEIPTDPSPVPEWEPLATPSDLVDKDEPELEETLGSDSLLTVSETPTDPSPVPEWEPLATPSDLVDKDEPELEETLGSDSLLTVSETPTDPSPVPEWEPLATPSDMVDKDEPELEETLGSDSLLTVLEIPTDPSPVPEWEPLATPSDMVDKDEPELEETLGSDSLLTVSETPTDPSPVPEWEPLVTPSDLVDKDEPITSSVQDTEQQEPEVEEANDSLNTQSLVQSTEESSGPSPVREPITTSPDLLGGDEVFHSLGQADEDKINDVVLSTDSIILEDQTNIPDSEQIDEDFVKIYHEESSANRSNPEKNANTKIFSHNTTNDGESKTSSSGSSDESSFQIVDEEQVQKSKSNESFSDVSETPNHSIDFPDSSMTDSQESAVFLDLSDLDKSQTNSAGELQLRETEKPDIPRKDSILDSQLPESQGNTSGSLDVDFTVQADVLESQGGQSISAEGLSDFDAVDEVPRKGSSLDLDVAETLQTDKDFDSVPRKGSILDSDMLESNEDTSAGGLLDFESVVKEKDLVQDADVPRKGSILDLDVPEPSEPVQVLQDTEVTRKGSILDLDVPEPSEPVQVLQDADVPRKGSILDLDVPEPPEPVQVLQDTEVTRKGSILDLDEPEPRENSRAIAGGLLDFESGVKGNDSVQDTEVPRKESLLDLDVPEPGGLSDFDNIERKGSILDSDIAESNVDTSVGLLNSAVQDTEVPRKDSLLDLDVPEPGGLSEFDNIERKGSILDSDIAESNVDTSVGLLDSAVQDTEVPRKDSLLDLDVPEPGGLSEFDNIERKGSILDSNIAESNVDTSAGLLDRSVKDTEVPRKGSILDLDVPEPIGNTSAPLDIESIQRKGSILDSDIPESNEKTFAVGLAEFDSDVQVLQDTEVTRKGSILDLDEPEPGDHSPAIAGGLLDFESGFEVKESVHDISVPRKGSILDLDVPEPQVTSSSPIGDFSEIENVERKGSILDYDIAETNVDTSAEGLLNFGSEGLEVQRKDSLLDYDVPESNKNMQPSVEGLLNFDSEVQRKDSLLDSDISERHGNTSSMEGLLDFDFGVQNEGAAGQEHASAVGLLDFGMSNQTDGEQLDSLMDSTPLQVDSEEKNQDTVQSEGDVFGMGRIDVVTDQTLLSENLQDSLQNQTEVDPFGIDNGQSVQTLTSENLQNTVKSEVDLFGISGNDLELVQAETSGNSLQSQADVDLFGIDGNDIQTGQSQISDSNLLFDFSASDPIQDQSQSQLSSEPSQDVFGGLLDFSSSAPIDTQAQAGDQSQLLDIFGSQDSSAGNQPSVEGDPPASSGDLI